MVVLQCAPPYWEASNDDWGLHDQGASRSQVQLRDILISPGINANVYQGDEFFMSNVTSLMDEEGNITDKGTIGFLEKCMNGFRYYAKAIDRMNEEMSK